jgi:hypothetical protein
MPSVGQCLSIKASKESMNCLVPVTTDPKGEPPALTTRSACRTANTSKAKKGLLNRLTLQICAMRWTVKFCSSLLVSCTGASPSPHVTMTRTAPDSLANRWLRCKHAENAIQHCGRNSHGFPYSSIVSRWRQSNTSFSLSCTALFRILVPDTPLSCTDSHLCFL